MTTSGDRDEGIRGGELADDATGAAPPPEQELGADGLRGDGLAQDAEERLRAVRALEDERTAQDGIRGDGLAGS